MKLVFLGTTSMIPTKERNHSSILLSYEHENMLIDCGEGTQRQLRIYGFPPPRITRIFLTHWHGDHFFGLPGMIDNLARHNYKKILYIYGPKGTKKFFTKMLESFALINKIDIKYTEIKNNGKVFEHEDFFIEAYFVLHTAPCVGYRLVEKDRRKIDMKKVKAYGLQEGPVIKEFQKGKDITFMKKKIKAKDVTYVQKGKKIAIILDTKECKSCYTLAKDVDLLVCESTYCEDKKEQANEYFHLTSKQAATIAKKAKAKRLILTHISQRYRSTECFEKEAKSVFPNTVLAHDFFTITI